MLDRSEVEDDVCLVMDATDDNHEVDESAYKEHDNVLETVMRARR